MAILEFCSNYFVIFLIIGIILAFGVSGYYVDKNTNILDMERQKKALLEKSMSAEAVKKMLKNKNVSLGGAMGLKGNGDNNQSQAQPVISNASLQQGSGNEDLSVPLNLNTK